MMRLAYLQVASYKLNHTKHIMTQKWRIYSYVLNTECFMQRLVAGYHIVSLGCRGDECNKTFDLTKDDCRNPMGDIVPTHYPGMKPTNSIDCTCSIEDLIRATCVQSALGALVGLLSFMLVVVIIGWVRTYFVMRGRGEIRNLHQVR